MSRIKTPVLNEKHLKALSLIDKGGLSMTSIAKECGWKMDYLYELYEGDTSKAGSVAAVFAAEVRKIDKKRTQHIKELSKSNKEKLNEQIARIIKEYEGKSKLTEHDKKMVGTLMNCLAKATPSVEIGSVSYSYTKGYTAEQLVHEYRRLQTLAGDSSNRRAVSGTSTGRTGTLPGITEPRSEVAEEQ